MQIQARLDDLNASIARQQADGPLLEQLVEDAATKIPSWELRSCWSFRAFLEDAGVRDLGYCPRLIAACTGVTDKTAAKALRWFDRRSSGV